MVESSSEGSCSDSEENEEKEPAAAVVVEDRQHDEVDPWDHFDSYVASLSPSPDYLASAVGEMADAAASADIEDYVPAMPIVVNVRDKRKRHRNRVPHGRRLLFNAPTT